MSFRAVSPIVNGREYKHTIDLSGIVSGTTSVTCLQTYTPAFAENLGYANIRYSIFYMYCLI